jgi:hypothetical protein
MRRGLRVLRWAVALLILCAGAGARSSVRAAVFRDRAAFEAASQNLHTIDFETRPPNFRNDFTIDGIRFENLGGPADITAWPNVQTKILRGGSVGELTRLTVYLPPGTTAVGCEQFSAPMTVSTGAGEAVTMNQSDGSSFVGFVSAAQIRSLTFFLDFPEPTPDVLLDNLSYGQRRAGNEPPAPLLLATDDAGRAAALDSVNLTSEPFNVANAHNFSADAHTRVTLFVAGVSLEASDASLVTARAEDSRGRVFDLPVEAVGRVKNFSWMSQVTVRLREELSGAGDLGVTLTVRGAQSNRAALRVE